MADQQGAVSQLTRLRGVLQELAQVPSLDVALTQVLRDAQVEGADCGGVFLLPDQSEGLLYASLGMDEPFRRALTDFLQGPQAAAARTAKAACQWQAAELAALGLAASSAGALRHLLAEPIVLDGQTLGLVLFGSFSRDAFPPHSRSYLEVLATLATTAVARARARQELERREALFRSLYERAPLPYQSLDAAGNILEVNEAWETLFGRPRDQVLGRNITEFLDESSLPTLMSEFPRFQERGYVNGAEFIIRPLRGEERRITVTGRASYDDAGRFVRTHCLLTDITEARRVDDEMRALLAEQQLILDNAVVGLAVFRDRRFMACNRYFESLLGYGPGELIGQSAQVIHRSEEHFLERGRKIYQAISEGKNFVEEEAFLAKDGSLVWLHVTGRASDPSQPATEPSVWIFVDLSDRRRAEEEVKTLNASLEERVLQRTAELEAAMRDMEAYSYSISHDLRAPLRAINGFAQLLQERLGPQLDAENAAMFERVIRNSKKMGDLIDDILEYSRLGRETLQRGEVDIDRLARNVAEELLEAYPATRVEYGDLPPVHGDPTMLRQVLENLLGNAFKYSASVPAPVVRISGAKINGEVMVSVGDNGVGFDMQHAGRLFGMFQRLHPEHEFRGTGVGLAIVKRLIERHGGRVSAEAVPNRGARFCFWLPTLPKLAAGMQKIPQASENACNPEQSRA